MDASGDGKRIRAARRKRGLSQHALAIRLGITRPAICHWEAGVSAPRAHRILVLADILETTPEYLQFGTATRPRQSTVTAELARFIERAGRRKRAQVMRILGLEKRN